MISRDHAAKRKCDFREIDVDSTRGIRQSPLVNTSTKQTNAAPATSGALKPETYTAPSGWASYLINGDASGIDDNDQREADAFVESVGAGSPVDCTDAGFIHRPDFGKLAGDCQAYTFLRRASSPTHTPEPWRHSADLPHHGCRLIHAADGYLVADAGRITKRTGDEMDSNARRIVECVNACAGMTDPAAEIAALRACADRLADYVEWHKVAIPSSERDDYEREYLIEGSESLIALAGKGDK